MSSRKWSKILDWWYRFVDLFDRPVENWLVERYRQALEKESCNFQKRIREELEWRGQCR